MIDRRSRYAGNGIAGLDDQQRSGRPTIRKHDDDAVADVAWVIAAPDQRRGYAREAAAAMVGRLRRHGARVVNAYVRPQHEASMAVARSLGLHRTETMVDGEVRWRG